ncbi:high affinity immunoglobulin gamma Fc receptor I-like [Paramisgurnus dabryanus]|uniref:high affinity immunoglobulin gamma Fc receptor I-like n=1 Tax=Paramisgurnus dabryanus TaxID=90735 RepID=UPI003CCF7DBB
MARGMKLSLSLLVQALIMQYRLPDGMLISNIHSQQTKNVDKPTLTVQPQTSVFIGDSVTLICDVLQSTGWEFIFITPSKTKSTETTGTKTIRSVRVSDGGEYKCIARRIEIPQDYTQYSNPITVTVQKRPTAQVSVWPDDRVFRGETVNLRCVINGGGVSSWQYSWYKDDSDIQQNKLQYYTIRSVSESDSGKYTCRGTETRGSIYSDISNAVTLTVSGSKPELTSDTEGSVLTGNTVTLKCHIDHWSTGWKFYWYNNTQNTEKTTTQTNSYTIHRVKVLDGGQYWCRAGRGKPDYYTDYSDGLWINVTDVDVILDSPVHPVTEGHNLTLRCLYRYKKPSNLRAEFYKDGSLVQNQTTGDMMIIPTVSKSHEGFYYCKHPERGESPKSWISVRGVYQEVFALNMITFLLAVCPYLIATVVLVLKCCRLRGESSV